MIPRVRLHPQYCDLELSQLVYGTWRLLDNNKSEELQSRILQCLQWGVTSFDCADIYGGGGHQCESAFGRSMNELLSGGRVKRSQFELISKCNILFPTSPGQPPAFPIAVQTKHYDSSRAYIVQRVEESLQALQGCQYLDLLLLHRPDFLMDPREVHQAFQELLDRGLVRYFGVSNFSPSQFEMLNERLKELSGGRILLVTNQIEWNVVNQGCLYDGTMDQLMVITCRELLFSFSLPINGSHCRNTKSVP